MMTATNFGLAGAYGRRIPNSLEFLTQALVLLFLELPL
jgi:hypothetical protein